MVQAPETETIQITLPQWPPEDSLKHLYPELKCWKITIGTPEEITVFYTTDSTVYYNFKINQPACITAAPITLMENGNSCNYFKPAGFLYPYAPVTKSQATADWNQGFLAHTMIKILESKKETGVSEQRMEVFLSTFNWKKAQETIENKIGKTEGGRACYNPWLIDSTRLLENLCYGNFKATYLNLTGCYEFSRDAILQENQLILLSSFVSENQNFNDTGKIYLKKDSVNFLCDGKQFGVIIHCKSAKNISREFVYLPIYSEEL